MLKHCFPGCSYQRLHIGGILPAEDLAIGQINKTIKHFAALADAHHIRHSVWSRSVHGILHPLQHDLLGRLPQSNCVEGDLAVLFPDDSHGILDFGLGERIERVRRAANACNMARSLLQTVKSHCDM